MHKLMKGLARSLAIVGGIVLSLLILLTCASILGRLLNGFFHGDFMQSVAPGLADWFIAIGVGPVNGDFELVEAGVAFAIFCFLPLCQITAGHACVDIFASSYPRLMNRFLKMVTELVFAAVLVLIAWKLFDGMLSKRANGETTFLLQFPIWWAYALSFCAAFVAAIVGLYMGAVRLAEFLTGRVIVHEGSEAGH